MKTTARRRAATMMAFALAAAACGASDDTSADPSDSTPSSVATSDVESTTDQETSAAVTPDAESTTGVATSTPGAPADLDLTSLSFSTADAVESAQWASNVTIKVGNGAFTYESNGLPSHELPDQFLIPKEGNMPPFNGDNVEDEFEIRDTDGLIVETALDVTITTTPVWSPTTTATSLGSVGMTVSGAPLFNDYEDMTRENIALDDNISLDGVWFIDACNGHPLASGNSYHYHGIPYCITDTLDQDGEHSTMLGVVLDGFPLYGNKDNGGVALTSDDLDECSGHYGVTAEFPDGIYHYHLTEDRSPYSIDCYHGVIDEQGGDQPGGGGPPPNGAPAPAQGTNNDEGAMTDGPPDGAPPPNGGPPPDGSTPPEGGPPPDGGQPPANDPMTQTSTQDEQ